MKVALAVPSDYFTHPAEGFISIDGHGQANDASRVFARQFLEDAWDAWLITDNQIDLWFQMWRMFHTEAATA